jgi:hypothetical protein
MAKEKKYTISDHFVAMSIVSLMVLTIVLIPFLLFYFTMHIISLTQDVSLNATNTISSIKIVFMFYIFTLITTGIVELIFSHFQMVRTNQKNIDFILEAILMFLVYCLFVQIYCILNDGIILKNNGNLYVALFLWAIYLILHIIYILSKKVHQLIINCIKRRFNNKKTK